MEDDGASGGRYRVPNGLKAREVAMSAKDAKVSIRLCPATLAP
jgi:hypothetical protein